ncbi:amidohydrolase [Microcella sp.]|uniref:amidohydrolase n=1 Tax=Microcella sp. TaxID=1913979 RepID=UPI00391D191A
MATTLFHGGTIWCGESRGTAHSLLIADGVVVALDDDAERRGAEADERVDLEGGFLMPSFGDGHAHPIFGGLEAEGPAIRSCTSVDEIVEAVRRYAGEHPELSVIRGASYDPTLTADGVFDARWLDAAVADRPVVLRASDYHTAWCNSLALERAGITAETPEPELGEIPRRPDGTPAGTLREWGAVELLTAAVEEPPLETRIRALERAGAYFLARGVTWVQDAWVEPADVDVYVAAARAGRIPLRMNLAHYADPRRFPAQLAEMQDARAAIDDAGSPLLTAHTVKFFADGVIENETGALLEPYCSAIHSHGMEVWGPERLADAVAAVDAAGFQIHIHAIGDAAVRQSLDAIEHAQRVNGPRDRRAVIAHAQLVDPDDLARFARLGVIPTLQPLWAQLDALMTVLTMPRLGPERSARQYPTRTLRDSGARVAFGSDWPVSSGDPRDGIAVATSRQTPAGEPAGGWIPEETLPIESALSAYTEGVAHQAFADRSAAPWGVIEVGSSADLVWLARDPRAVSPLDLPAVEIRQTYLAGTSRITEGRNGAAAS